MEWQSIETAPRDGAEVLLFVPEVGFVEPYITVGSFYEALGHFEDGYGGAHSATHWMPLPEPPHD